ncbi:MAG TPA: CHRD domain-containing protein [Candidatus Limnocylindria bacterium]|nr:CHRD domain-containing protein [Candidatus Limnocylindria bacterium]
MKRLVPGLVAVLLAAACGGTAQAPTPTATTAAPTTAAPTATPAPTPAAVVLKADLKSSEENPPIAGPEASCSGTGEVTFNPDRSVKFDVEIKGCPDSAVINIGHIHEGAKGTNGAVRVNTGLVAGELKLTAGGVKFTKNVASVDAAVFSAILANPAGYYLNFHSAANATGVIRGQLEKK